MTDLKPVNGAAVDEGRKLSQSVSKGVSERAEGDDDVEIGSTPVDEEGEESKER